MWHDGKPAAEQCEGCTFFTGHARELSYLHSRDVTTRRSARARTRRARDTATSWAGRCRGTRHATRGTRCSPGASSAVVCYLRDGDRVFETYWTTGRGVEAGATSYHLLDLTVYGRQETWEDSPEGWPQPYASAGEQFRTDGRPTPQWSRLAAGRSDDLSG